MVRFSSRSKARKWRKGPNKVSARRDVEVDVDVDAVGGVKVDNRAYDHCERVWDSRLLRRSTFRSNS